MKKRILQSCGGLLIAAALMLGLLAVGGLALDDEIDTHVESNLSATPQALYPLLTTQAGLVQWWGEAADREAVALAGPAEGVGMQVEIRFDGMVFEHWTLTEAEPGQVRYTIDLQGFILQRTITLTEHNGGTWAIWEDSGVIESPFMRYLTLLPEDVLLTLPYSALSALDAAAQ
ncbi:MAG: hypothetical protein ACI8RZ_007776 [Myxococcota bacterium]|jgi:hypothetical protein